MRKRSFERSPPLGCWVCCFIIRQRLWRFILMQSCRSSKLNTQREEKPCLRHVLKALLQKTGPNKLTSNKIQDMIDGYPPLYRETFKVRCSAIKDLRDTHSRGAWIVATGQA